MQEIQEQKDKIIDWLKQLVEINSIYPNEGKICDFIRSKFENLGYKVETNHISEDRYNVVVSKKEFRLDSKVALYSHLDTVKNVEGWTKDPFKLTLEGDMAYGLGSYDMKGGMVANILTFLDESLADFQMYLIFCVDEENISTGAHELIKTDLLENVECIISPEPAFKYDQNGITIGRVGHPMFALSLKRPSAHFMFYEPAIDLNLLASRFINKLTDIFIEQDDRRQFIYVNKYNTTNHGMSVPESVEIELEVSLLPPLSSDELLENLREILQIELNEFCSEVSFELEYKSRPTPFLDPYEIKGDNKFLKYLSDSVETVTNKNAEPYFRSSVGDDNVFANAGFTVLGIGPSGAGAHAPDEWVSISSIERLKLILVEFILACTSK